MRSVSVLLRGRPEDGSPSPRPPTTAGATNAALITRRRRSAVRIVSCKWTKEKTMNRSMALGLAMVAGSAFVATAINGLLAQNVAPGAYADLDLRAINSPAVLKTLPSKTGDFDSHTA